MSMVAGYNRQYSMQDTVHINSISSLFWAFILKIFYKKLSCIQYTMYDVFGLKINPLPKEGAI